MKTTKNITILSLLFFMAGIPFCKAQDKESLIATAKYFMYDNQIPFVQIKAQTKVDKKLQPVPDIHFQLYLDSVADNRKIGSVKTNKDGNATVAIPPSLKNAWDASTKHTILSNSDATKKFEAAELETEVTQAKLVLDTLNDGEARSITATLMEKTDKGWNPVKATDLKIGVKRLGGILSAGSDETFATNDDGKATAAFDRDKLPGDKNGILTLTAKLEDNEVYGNLVVEMNAPWGAKLVPGHDAFNDRSLWATRKKAPYWLLFIANSIIISVWGTIIYLITQIFKIRKLGKI